MATPTDLYDDAVALLDQVIGAGTHMASDWLASARIPAGQSQAYQVRVDPVAEAATGDSNLSYEACLVDVVVALRVAPGAETDEQREAFRDLLSAVEDPGAWRGLASVHEVLDGPELQGNSERVGNVLRATVSLRALLALA